LAHATGPQRGPDRFRGARITASVRSPWPCCRCPPTPDGASLSRQPRQGTPAPGGGPVAKRKPPTTPATSSKRRGFVNEQRRNQPSTGRSPRTGAGPRGETAGIGLGSVTWLVARNRRTRSGSPARARDRSQGAALQPDSHDPPRAGSELKGDRCPRPLPEPDQATASRPLI